MNTIGSDKPIEISFGGTGVATLTQYGVLVGNGATDIQALAVGSTNEVLLGNTGANPSWGTVGNSALTNSSVTLSDGDNITVTGSPLSLGGTATIALSGMTQYALQVGNASGSLTDLAIGNAGQVLQSGGAGADPAWSTATYPSTATQGDLICALADNTFTAPGAGTATYVLAAYGAGAAPTWQANTLGTVTSVSGGTNISTSGTATDPVIDLDATITLTTVNATTFDTNVAAAGVTLTGTTLSADGTDSDIDINITPKGTGSTVITNPSFNGDLIAVSDGGTGSSSFTDGGILLGSGAGSITATSQPTDGQLLIGHTGADPDLATLTASTGITVTNAAGSITIASTGTTVVVDTSTSKTLVIGDAGKFITMNNAAAIALNIPLNSSVAFPVGTIVSFQQLGAGQITVTPAGGVTLQSADNAYTTVKQYSGGCIIKTATDQWGVFGDMEA